MPGKILFSVVSIGLTTLEGPKVKKHLPGTSRLSIVRAKFLQPMPRRAKLVFVNSTSQKHFCLKGETEIVVFKLSHVRMSNFLQYYIGKFSQRLKKVTMK